MGPVADKLHVKGFGIMRLKSHIIEVSALTVVACYVAIPYSAPILASLWAHVAMDVAEAWTRPERR